MASAKDWANPAWRTRRRRSPLKQRARELFGRAAKRRCVLADVIDADARNRIAACRKERAVAKASGKNSVRHLDKRIAEYRELMKGHAILRKRVLNDFAGDF